MEEIHTLKGHLPLGKGVDYDQLYSPNLLCVISREQARAELGISLVQPVFTGADLWTAYEISWLNLKGKPVIACATFLMPADSLGMIESKSFKLYLNSFNQTKFSDFEQVKGILIKDLSAAIQKPVQINLSTGEVSALVTRTDWPGICLDVLDVEIEHYQVKANLLKADVSIEVEEVLHSHLFRSHCPVTSQPDWASVLIRYQGRQINRQQLLRYLCSYRQHAGFHEQCVENIFMDILRECGCKKLSVEARFLRRGGLDINPFRTNCGDKPLDLRLVRQ